MVKNNKPLSILLKSKFREWWQFASNSVPNIWFPQIIGTLLLAHYFQFRIRLHQYIKWLLFSTIQLYRQLFFILCFLYQFVQLKFFSTRHLSRERIRNKKKLVSLAQLRNKKKTHFFQFDAVFISIFVYSFIFFLSVYV